MLNVSSSDFVSNALTFSKTLLESEATVDVIEAMEVVAFEVVVLKDEDMVIVLRTGRAPKVVTDFDPVIVEGCSTVVVSTFSSLMKMTLSLLAFISSIGLEAALTSSSVASSFLGA